jgi:translation initiation factor 1
VRRPDPRGPANSRPVYSTDGGAIGTPRPVSPPRSVSPARGAPPVPRDGVVRVFRDRGGRGGKTVTVIHGLPAAALESRAAELKRLCGAGGAVKDTAVEIQGDHRERIAEHLRAAGHTVKLAGG